MSITTFDSLDYYEKLKKAGVPEEQAKAQANAFRDFTIIQEENYKKELATKGDVYDVRLEIEKVRKEIEEVRKEIEQVKYGLLKWQIGGWVALAAIMAKGFGWLGF